MHPASDTSAAILITAYFVLAAGVAGGIAWAVWRSFRKDHDMTDPATAEPIVVNSSPAQDQWIAGARQVTLVLGPVAAFAAANHMLGLSSDINLAIAVAGPLATLISLVAGQFHTRHAAERQAVMADALPDSVAKTK